ncbi:hypothetical protein PsorP6_002742 [Peronosclerospora sorghi]|uniref:Uncharacterized protein n=1 Tax=Peronosclerospora sorghi TaxID=230839 RepID=A0ACC0WTB3_9STRA|nr:hypothetical protein PsorP6_002742 [Peronosclerospora sorghi]
MLDALYDAAIEEISSFYGEVHISLKPSGIPWEEALASPNGVHSMALTDFLQVKGSLNQRLTQLRYDLGVEEVAPAKEAKRATAMDIEATMPTAQTKQVNQLKEALKNDSAGRRGAPTGAKKAAMPQQQKRSPSANGAVKSCANAAAKSGRHTAPKNSAKQGMIKPAKRAPGKPRSK